MMKNSHRDSSSGGSRGGFRSFGGKGSGGRAFGGGRSGGGGKSFGGGRSFGKPELFRAVCDECGKECEVPFRPSGERPVYCKECFGSQGDSPRSGGTGGKSFGGRSDFEEKRMYDAVCDECGADCEVPFRPTGERPVYCSKCFGNQGDSRSAGRERGGRDFEEKRMYPAVCDECGEDCEVPFRATGEKPVYCSKCFKKDSGGSGGGHSEDQFAQLNIKLDRILKALASIVPQKQAGAPQMKESPKPEKKPFFPKEVQSAKTPEKMKASVPETKKAEKPIPEVKKVEKKKEEKPVQAKKEVLKKTAPKKAAGKKKG